VAVRPALVVRWPRSVLLATALVSLLALVAVVDTDPLRLHLTIDPSTEPLLPRNDPARDLYRQAVQDFGDDEVYVIAMETEDAFDPGALARLRRVNDIIARFPEVRQVQSLVDVISFRWMPEEQWIEVAALIDEIPEDPDVLRELRERTLADPLYQRTLVSDDGATAALNVTFRELTDREFIESRLDERIEEVLAAEATEGVTFYVAGRPHLKATVYRLMLRDLRVLIPASLLVLAIGLFIVFGTRRGVVLPVAVVLVATLWTFATMAYLERPLSVLTTLLAPMLIAIGSVYGIHALSLYEEEVRGGGSAQEVALRSLTHLRLPVGIAGATTVVGFSALMITDVPAVLELGAFSALGVASITLLTLGALHAALALLPPRAPGAGAARRSHHIAELLDDGLTRLADAVVEHHRAVLLVFLAVSVACAGLVPRIVIDTDYLSFFDEDSKVRRDFEAVNRLLSGAVPLYVSLRGEGAGAFRSPDVLHAVERIQERAGEIEGVSRSLSMVDTVRVMNRAMSEDDPAEERIPETRPAVAELVFMAPKGHLDRYTNVNHGRANVLVRTGAVGTAQVQRITHELEAIVRGAGLPEGIEAGVTGNAILLARSADGIARGQPRSVGLAALTILFLITLSIRSLRAGLIAMVPNIVPVLMFFGVLGAGVAPLSLPTSLIGCVALGIAIDDTVHFLVRYQKERARGATPEEAVRVCMRRVGRPIAITSFMLILGFLVVALSSFATLTQFGLLSAATMGFCLVTDLILLPALLVRTQA